MQKYLFLMSLIFTMSRLAGQNAPYLGSATFTGITPDAGSAAIGGAGVAIPGNAYSFFHNGASFLFGNSSKGAVSYSFVPWLTEIESGHSLHSLGGFYKLDPGQGLLAGFRYFNYPESGILDNNGNTLSSFRPKELSIDIGYARKFTGNLALSFTARYINSDMGNEGGAKAANAVAFDLGAMYSDKIVSPDGASWAAGLRIGNIGTNLKYLRVKEDMPAIVKLGGSVSLPFSGKHNLVAALDLGQGLYPADAAGFSTSAGVEYCLMQRFFARGGYHYGNKDKGDQSYATSGIGLKFFGLNADFAYLIANSGSMLKNTSLITVGYSF